MSISRLVVTVEPASVRQAAATSAANVSLQQLCLALYRPRGTERAPGARHSATLCDPAGLALAAPLGDGKSCRPRGQAANPLPADGNRGGLARPCPPRPRLRRRRHLGTMLIRRCTNFRDLCPRCRPWGLAAGRHRNGTRFTAAKGNRSSTRSKPSLKAYFSSARLSVI